MNATDSVVVTETVRDRLDGIFDGDVARAVESRESLESLKDALKMAVVVRPTALPVETVSIDSAVVLKDLDSSVRETYTLVYPENADIGNSCLSVLAPIGAVILGRRVGDTVRATVANRIRTLLIESVQSRTGVRVSLTTKQSDKVFQNDVDLETKPIPEIYFG